MQEPPVAGACATPRNARRLGTGVRIMSEDKFDKLMRDAAETFRRPPEPPLDEMWAEIEARAGFRAAAPIESVTPITAARRGFRVPSWVAIAATLVIGIGIGRGSTAVGHNSTPSNPSTVAKAEP